MYQLEWLAIEEIIDFENATIGYESLHGWASPYMQGMYGTRKSQKPDNPSSSLITRIIALIN